MPLLGVTLFARQPVLERVGTFQEGYTLTVDEVIPAAPPELILTLATVKELPCRNIPIDASLKQKGNKIDIEVRGIGETGHCIDAVGPATYSQRLDIPSGVYKLTIKDRGRWAAYKLTLSESSVVLTGSGNALVLPDRRIKWRVPPNSLVLGCGKGRSSREEIMPLCWDVIDWIEQLPTMQQFGFPSGGVNPYYKGPDTSAFSYFKYQDASVLSSIPTCLVAIEDQVREAVGVSVTVQVWDGSVWYAMSRRAYHERHIQVPRRVTNVAACDHT
jgi:hypothetical protein